MARSQEDRIDRLERVVHVIPEDQLSLQKIVAGLATETRRGFDRVAKQSAETDRRMRQTDERIDKLVVAIGEFVRKPSKN